MTIEQFLASWTDTCPTLQVRTSGSTGVPKEITVEKARMKASARMTCDFLGLLPGDTALLCMPLDFIAGKMMVVRAQERQLRLISVPPSGHPLAEVDEPITFAAMVPLQVWNSLQVPAERQRLMCIRHLLIGGGAIDVDMEAELRTFPHKVWSSYGMTETLSHIALRSIQSDWYRPLPHVRLSQTAEGCLVVEAPQVCPERLVTHDIVRFNEEGGFRVIGRSDNVVCSGGVKIQIEEVEAALYPVYRDSVQVTTRKDAKFGEIVVLLSTSLIDVESLRQLLPNPYWLPKEVKVVPTLPRTATGKPDRAAARRIASE